MKFRLTYEGPLYATQGEPRGKQQVKRADHKHTIRRHFHHQLKQLWEEDLILRDARINPYVDMKKSVQTNVGALMSDEIAPLAQVIADQFQDFGYNFVPLVRKCDSLLCSLDILFLRRDAPGAAIDAGDVDNRIKTLIDALRRPLRPEELKGNESPKLDENPFFCLLEDDKLVAHFSVETDRLLESVKVASASDHDVKLVITVNVRPYVTTMDNVGYV